MNFEIFNETRGPPGPPAVLNVNSIPIDNTWTISWNGFTNPNVPLPTFGPLTDYIIVEEFEKTVRLNGQINFITPVQGLATAVDRVITLNLSPPQALENLFPPVKDSGNGSSQLPGSLSAINKFSAWYIQGTRIPTGNSGSPVINPFSFEIKVSEQNLVEGELQLSWVLTYQKE